MYIYTDTYTLYTLYYCPNTTGMTDLKICIVGNTEYIGCIYLYIHTVNKHNSIRYCLLTECIYIDTYTLYTLYYCPNTTGMTDLKICIVGNTEYIVCIYLYTHTVNKHNNIRYCLLTEYIYI